MQRSRRIAHPTGIETHVDDHVLDFRQAPSVAIVEQETSLGTEGVLAEVALGSSGCFPAFDDLVTLRGYPETFSHGCGEIMQPPCGNETQGDRMERFYSA